MEQAKKIIDILCDICGAQPEEIDGDLDLFEEGLLDSFGVIQLVLALEEAFGVTLEIGEVSGIVPDYMTDCWKYYRKKSELFKDSDLKIEILPAVTYCEACQKTYPTVEFGRQCPGCGSFETYLLTGNECSIKEIEAC